MLKETPEAKVLFKSTFMSADEIIHAIKTRELRIAYYSIIGKDGKRLTLSEKRFVKVDPDEDTDELDLMIRDYLFSSLEPDSLRFHIGPYAMVEVFRGVEGRKFTEKRGDKYILNVEKSQKLLIYPQEFCLIGTNEYVEVSETIGGSLYANVRNTDIGLSHISTMIDPSWKGILQVGVTNPTRYTKQLNYLDSLCAIRFHRLQKPVSNEIVEKFRIARPHFGNDWWLLMSEKGREIFPRRKEYTVGGVFWKRIRIEIIREKILKYGLVGVIIALMVGGIRIYDRIGKIDKNYEKIQSIETDLLSLQEIEKKFHVLDAGSKNISFKPQKNKEDLSLILSSNISSPPMVLLTFEKLSSSELVYTTNFTTELIGNEKIYRTCHITVEFVGSFVKSETKTGKMNWLIIYPKKN